MVLVYYPKGCTCTWQKFQYAFFLLTQNQQDIVVIWLLKRLKSLKQTIVRTVCKDFVEFFPGSESLFLAWRLVLKCLTVLPELFSSKIVLVRADSEPINKNIFSNKILTDNNFYSKHFNWLLSFWIGFLIVLTFCSFLFYRMHRSLANFLPLC